MKEVFARKPEFLPNKIPDSCWLLSASGHLVSLSCSESLNWNYWLTRIKEQRLILFQILKSYWNDFPLYNKELKIFECGDQIIPIPNQRNNCNVCLRLRKEIPVNSARIARICSTPSWYGHQLHCWRTPWCALSYFQLLKDVCWLQVWRLGWSLPSWQQGAWPRSRLGATCRSPPSACSPQDTPPLHALGGRGGHAAGLHIGL